MKEDALFTKILAATIRSAFYRKEDEKLLPDRKTVIMDLDHNFPFETLIVGYSKDEAPQIGDEVVEGWTVYRVIFQSESKARVYALCNRKR